MGSEMLAKLCSTVLYPQRVVCRSAPQLDGLAGVFAYRVKERALTHKYKVGETVYFTASNVSRPAATGTYEVIRLLPTDGDDCQYRIKSTIEAFERVAKESQLKAA
jgi:hypothetical protein